MSQPISPIEEEDDDSSSPESSFSAATMSVPSAEAFVLLRLLCSSFAVVSAFFAFRCSDFLLSLDFLPLSAFLALLPLLLLLSLSSSSTASLSSPLFDDELLVREGRLASESSVWRAAAAAPATAASRGAFGFD